MEVVHEEIGESHMQCTNHPYKNSTPGGICAFCLQEKLGKLISSSFPAAIFPSSSSSPSPSPSFRSDFAGSSSAITTVSAATASLQLRSVNSRSGGGDSINNYHGYYPGRSKIPLVLARKKKEMQDGAMALKRSRSITTPRRGMRFLDEKSSEDYSPHRRGFWSFLYLSKHSNRDHKDAHLTSATPSSVCSTLGSSSVSIGPVRSREKRREDFVAVDENGSPELDRKVSRSRSVGCGSRSFSGDFFERISTGFGDCTLRRVESHREGKSKVPSLHRNGQDCIKERVKCGGIFSGFMITSSSAENTIVNGKSAYGAGSTVRHPSHGRNRSWGWTFASPMRAFIKPSAGKRDVSLSRTATPNLAAIPSLLAGRS